MRVGELGLTQPKRIAPPKFFAVSWKDLQSRWGMDVNQPALSLANPVDGTYAVVCLDDVISDLENGWTPKCFDRAAEADEWGVLKMGTVSFGVFNANENKAHVEAMILGDKPGLQ